MKLFKKIVSSVMALCITVIPCQIESFAVTNSVHGQILMEDGSPVAGVTVNILSSVVDQVYDEDVTGFANTYYSSVVTDENGMYTFTKPSEYCLVEVDLKTLPHATGVDTNSIFLYPNETESAFTVYNIGDVEIASDGNVSMYDVNGNHIISDYTIERSIDNDINPLDIFDADEISMLESVNANGYVSRFNITEDLSEYSFVEKIDYLSDSNLIDEETKISAYLYALGQDECGEMECATPIYEELISYYDENESTTLGQQIVDTLSLTASSSSEMSSYYKTEKTATSGRFTIHYEGASGENDTMSSSDLNTIMGYISKINYTFFTSFKFPEPAYEKDNTTMHIYFAEEVNSATHFISSSSNPSGYGCYITISYNADSPTLADARETTLAHEIFHTIQESYKTKGHRALDWATEASATWAALRYYNKYRDKARSRAASYLNDTSLSLTDDSGSRQYGMFLFFQYISQKHGDTAAIKRIFEAFSSGDDIYSALEHCKESGTVTFRELFAGFQAFNADVSKYNNYTDGTNSYKNATVKGTNVTFGGVSIDPNAAKHYSYTNSTSSSSRLDLTFSVTGDHNKTALSLAKFNNSGTADLLRVYPTKATSFTYSISGFSTSKISKVTVALCNASTDNAIYSFSLSAKVA